MHPIALRAGSLLAVLAALGLGSCAGADIVGASDDCSLVLEGSQEFHGRSDTQVVTYKLLSFNADFTAHVATAVVDLGLLTDLCVAAPSSENTVSFDVTTTQEGAAIIATGHAQPAYGYEPYIAELQRVNGTHLQGTISHIGLRQGSQDGKRGYADLSIIISFPTQLGDAGSNLFWYEENVSKIVVSWHFERLSPD